jgi:phosphoserine phosphatase RsbU/P
MKQHRIACSEIWGGVRNVDLDVCAGGLTASVFSLACSGEMGGDIYYLSVCGNDRMTRIVLADVRGHGEQVSHISSRIYDSLRQNINTLGCTGVLTDLNAAIYGQGSNALTTATVVGFNLEESRLYYSYAGHSPAYLWHRASHLWSPLRLTSESGAANVVLGALPSMRFDQESTPFSQGDRLFVYTDGVIECRNADGHQFGADRLLTALGEADGDSLADVKKRVVESLRRHVEPASFHDDVTFMLAEIP